MKRILIATGLLLVILAAFFLLRQNMNRTHGEDPLMLRLESPAKVDKILLAPNHSKLTSLLIYRDKEGRWFMKHGEKTEAADTHSVHQLLFWVMRKVEVRNPVSDSEKETVTRDLALNGIKAVFYEGDREVHTVYAGSPTPDQEATYMYHPDMKRPAVVQISGFKGYLSPYFSVDPIAWLSPVLMDVPAEKISSVVVNWPAQKDQGFEIRQENGEAQLTTLSGNSLKARPNRLLSYLERFQNITREYGEIAGINRKQAMRDSILAAGPFFTLTVTDVSKKKSVIRLYHMALSSESYAQILRDGTPLSHETETFWVQKDDQKELWVIQGAIIRSRMKTLQDIMSDEARAAAKSGK